MASFALLSASDRKELWACLALRHAEGIGPLRAMRLARNHGSALAAVEAVLSSPSAWDSLVPGRVAREFAREKWRAAAGEEWSALRRACFSFLLWNDPDYPGILGEIPDAPLLLYCKGDPGLLRGPAVGVVGARSCTREGAAVTAFFSRALSRSGVTVISGMARGIDRVAHLAGLEGPGKSIAVLGTGIDRVYPLANADLAGKMESQGLVVSEFPPGAPPAPRHFPIRNRLISGLSRGILVVEAAARSGSLITARLALEQGREVFAVPGHTTAAVSGGCRSLIRQGARPVFSADDILTELAPLLRQEARQALEKRLEEEDRRARAPAPSQPFRQRREEDPAGAETVLPDADLPWLTPQTPLSGRRGTSPAGKGRTSPRPSDSKPPRPAPVPGGEGRAASLPDNLGRPERDILEALEGNRAHVDELSRRLGLDVSRLSGLLLMLEVRGLVARLPGGVYARPEDAACG
ncbi:MAG: DNA-processing protein DprA [Desulfovibrio sp.]|nr:DNA-processing protein DprA [Desulfovibrio sp.]